MKEGAHPDDEHHVEPQHYNPPAVTPSMARAATAVGIAGIAMRAATAAFHGLGRVTARQGARAEADGRPFAGKHAPVVERPPDSTRG